MKFSEVIAKPVISLYESEVQGIVFNAIFNESLTKIENLIIENNDNADEFLLNVKNIFSFGKDAIIVKNFTTLKLCIEEEEKKYNPINIKVYSTNGEYFGRVNDLEVNNNFVIEKFLCGEKSFNPSQILKFSNNLMLISEEKEKLNINKMKPKTTINIANLQSEQKAIILPIENYEKEKNIEKSTNIIPRVSMNNTGLLGRIVTQNIVAGNGEIIAKQGNVINEHTINLANMHQKMRELSFYAK